MAIYKTETPDFNGRKKGSLLIKLRHLIFLGGKRMAANKIETFDFFNGRKKVSLVMKLRQSIIKEK